MRARLLPLVTLASAVALAACGSTNYADTDNIVPAPDQAQTLKPPKTKIPVTGSSSTSTSASVPSSGPLSTEPKITVPSTPAPTTLVTKNIITGTGAIAKSGDELTVDYVGKVFDASWSHGGPKGVPFQFKLGVGDVIKGWDDGIVGMRVGGRRELIIPPALGYGTKGSPPTIPANSTLIFIVDLLAVK
jgi:peptidylprolyl isomerase